MNTRQLDAFGRTHYGLISRTVAERLGMSTSAWYRAIDGGRLAEIHPGVARMSGAPMTREQGILAAVWGAGTGTLASHRSSAYLWGAERPADEPIDVISPGRGNRAELRGVVVHRPTDRLELGPVFRGAIPTTPPLRMLLDLGAVHPAGVYPAMQTILINRVAPPRAVLAALERHARPGRHGVRALRRALARYPLAADLADSVLETAMAELVRKYALPAVEFHPLVDGKEIDFRIIGTNILLECDGRANHGEFTEGFETDRHRDQETLGIGYVTMRFTWAQITRQPGALARRIRTVVDRWAPHLTA